MDLAETLLANRNKRYTEYYLFGKKVYAQHQNEVCGHVAIT